jgi:hypothetical protein
MSKNKENQYFLPLSPAWIITDSALRVGERVCPNVRHENITLWLAIEIYSLPVSTANGIKFSFIKMSDRERLEICLFIVRQTRSYL